MHICNAIVTEVNLSCNEFYISTNIYKFSLFRYISYIDRTFIQTRSQIKQTVCKLNFLPSSSLIFVKTGYWAAIDEPRANEPQVNEPQTRGVVENAYQRIWKTTSGAFLLIFIANY
jgi:hypothetical protein